MLRLLRIAVFVVLLSFGSVPSAQEKVNPPEPRAAHARLHRAAHAWLKRDLDGDALRFNRAYADLLFAFGFARLKDGDQARKLVAQAADVLKGQDEAHRALLKAYTYRVEEALAGRPHAGPLPEVVFEPLRDPAGKGSSRMGQYIVDRQRDWSRVLEPQERVDPYRHWAGKAEGDLFQRVAALPDLRDAKELEKQIRHVFRAVGESRDAELRPTVLAAVLPLAPRVGRALVGELLKDVPPLLKGAGDGPEVRARRVALAETALALATEVGEADAARALLELVPGLLAAEPTVGVGDERLLATCAACVRGLDLRREAAVFADRLTERMPAGKELAALREHQGARWDEALCCLVHLAAIRLSLGEPEKARPILDLAQKAVFFAEEKDRLSSVRQVRLVRAYAAAVRHGPAEDGLKQLEELFQRLDLTPETFSTRTHYSRAHLMILHDAVVPFLPVR